MLPVHTLTTPRLTLRDWRDDDLEAFRALNLDREVRRFFPSLLAPYESDLFARGLRAFLSENGWGLWAVESLTSRGFLGFVGLARPTFEPFTACVEVGWRLARSAWGHGYATEAARAAVQFGFLNLGLREVVAFTVPSNTPSRRVMAKLGMVEAGDFLHPRVTEGHPLRRHLLYRLSFDAWSAGRMTPPVNIAAASTERAR
jgi:RimJ/RimL family protein N-acetyltransferase